MPSISERPIEPKMSHSPESSRGTAADATRASTPPLLRHGEPARRLAPERCSANRFGSCVAGNPFLGSRPLACPARRRAGRNGERARRR